MKHRSPPVPHWRKGPRFCRWCGEDSPAGRRWHPECVLAYKLAAESAEQRRVCWVRDQGVCGVCGLDTAKALRERVGPEQWRIYYSERVPDGAGKLWQSDHIRPLVDGGGLDLAYFAADNLRTTCTACHKAKTSSEASERAARLRETVQPPLL